MITYFSRQNLFVWLDGLKSDFAVFVPVKKGISRFYQRYTSPSPDIVIGEVRTAEPLKGFFTPAREKVAEGFHPELPAEKHKPFAIVGVKACDLTGFFVQDHVFLNNHDRDPFYAQAKEQTLIISADCTKVLETCFCLTLGHAPYPEGHFDINLSEVSNGFIVETGSPKGEQIVERYASLFQEVAPAAISERETIRQQVTTEVRNKIEKCGVPYHDQYHGMIERNYDSSLWKDEAKTCVECGACNTICPTCHCFLLTDQQEGCQFARFRQWDSCMLKDFARVAGGGNPRPQLWMRLRNRFEKKFDFFPKTADLYACTGCGRCISACPAKIDIRKVLKRLVHNE
ncbi:MAG: 4Fe-4S dicluster domain-containing protein [Candidatus Binatia bacterium]